MITPLPGATPLKPGCATLPLPGIFAEVIDEEGNKKMKVKMGCFV